MLDAIKEIKWEKIIKNMKSNMLFINMSPIFYWLLKTLASDCLTNVYFR